MAVLRGRVSGWTGPSGFARNADRVADRDAVIAAVDNAFGRYTRERLMAILTELGIAGRAGALAGRGL